MRGDTDKRHGLKLVVAEPLPDSLASHLETVRAALAGLNASLLPAFDAILDDRFDAMDQPTIDGLSDAFLTLFLAELDHDWEPSALGVAFDDAIRDVNNAWIEHSERTP